MRSATAVRVSPRKPFEQWSSFVCRLSSGVGTEGPQRLGRNRLTLAFVLVVVAIAVASATAYFVMRTPNPPPCCVPEPAKGQLFLQSYNFQVSGASGSFFTVLGVFEGQNVTLQQVYFDQTLLTSSNFGLSTWCGTQNYGSWTGYACTISFSFGSSLPPPPQGSNHVLRIVSSTGVTSSFQVMAGALYEATSTAGSPSVTVSGSVFKGCVGSLPLSVTFTNEGGQAFTAEVNATASSQTYSISLSNGHVYSVSVTSRPVVPNATPKTSQVGSLTLDVATPTHTYDVPC